MSRPPSSLESWRPIFAVLGFCVLVSGGLRSSPGPAPGEPKGFSSKSVSVRTYVRGRTYVSPCNGGGGRTPTYAGTGSLGQIHGLSYYSRARSGRCRARPQNTYVGACLCFRWGEKQTRTHGRTYVRKTLKLLKLLSLLIFETVQVGPLRDLQTWARKALNLEPEADQEPPYVRTPGRAYIQAIARSIERDSYGRKDVRMLGRRSRISRTPLASGGFVRARPTQASPGP